jgi:hypothetical protein
MQMYCTFVHFVNQHFPGLPTSGTRCSFVLFNTFITFFILNIRTCCSVRFAASETLAVFIFVRILV